MAAEQDAWDGTAEPPGLYCIARAARALGGISIWTVRKHVARGNIAVTRLGRRVFVQGEEIERIRSEGLPSLTGTGRARR